MKQMFLMYSLEIVVACVIALILIWGFVALLHDHHEIKKFETKIKAGQHYVINRESIKTVEDVVNVLELIVPHGNEFFNTGVPVGQYIKPEQMKYLKEV